MALQLLGKHPGREVEAAFVRILCAPERPLAERLLAVGSLRQRRPADAEALSRAVLPALLERSPAVREEAARLLAQLTEKRPASLPTDPEALHAAWRDALGVME